MGLDCFLIKKSKKKLREAYSALGDSIQITSLSELGPIPPETLMQLPVGQPLGLCDNDKRSIWTNEIAYYRNWRSLNSWMIELAKEKVPAIAKNSTCLSGRPILLTKEDLERLKMEVVFGDIMDDCPFPYYYLSGSEITSDMRMGAMNKFLAVVDKAIRICRYNKSLVFYLGSW
jgi:hypothetical protein